jgi:hypothetical protein
VPADAHVDDGAPAALGLHPVQERQDRAASPHAGRDARRVDVGPVDRADEPRGLAPRREEVLERARAPLLEPADRAEHRRVGGQERGQHVLEQERVRGVALPAAGREHRSGHRGAGRGRTSCGRIS